MVVFVDTRNVNAHLDTLGTQKNITDVIIFSSRIDCALAIDLCPSNFCLNGGHCSFNNDKKNRCECKGC